MTRRCALVLGLMGCGARAVPPTPVRAAVARPPIAPGAPVEEATAEDAGTVQRTGYTPPEAPEPTPPPDVATLYTIAFDRGPARCQQWKRDDETDEYRWSRREATDVHVQRLSVRGAALSLTDERHHADGSIDANTCIDPYGKRVDDAVISSAGTLFLTAKACGSALANEERVALRPDCTAPASSEENEAILARFGKLASSRGTMYAPISPIMDGHPPQHCEAVRLAGRAATRDGWIEGTATYARYGEKTKGRYRYRISFGEAIVELPGDDDDTRTADLIVVDDHIQTFENLFFTRAACDAELIRDHWMNEY
ncbi:MAG TPA: hypothetical protein VGM90_09160 [Kofleriaceae bacterium]